jgi:hypothetical protein
MTSLSAMNRLLPCVFILTSAGLPCFLSAQDAKPRAEEKTSSAAATPGETASAAEAKDDPAGKNGNGKNGGEQDSNGQKNGKNGANGNDGAPSNINVPEDLLDDEHVREEYGVNKFTTPSIKKLFEDLDTLGSLPYDALKRPLPKGTPKDRTLVALGLGVLIGDGFLSVQTEKISDLEDIGRAILKHAKVLGAGYRVTEHTKSILENSALGDWKTLREDLSKTQKDVEAEMVLLRDVDMAHLVSLGGWLRGLQIASTASLEPFSPKKAQILARHDIAEYFAFMLDSLGERMQKLRHIQSLKTGLAEIDQIINLPEGKPLTKEEVEKLHKKAGEMLEMIQAP